MIMSPTLCHTFFSIFPLSTSCTFSLSHQEYLPFLKHLTISHLLPKLLFSCKIQSPFLIQQYNFHLTHGLCGLYTTNPSLLCSYTPSFWKIRYTVILLNLKAEFGHILCPCFSSFLYPAIKIKIWTWTKRWGLCPEVVKKWVRKSLEPQGLSWFWNSLWGKK